MKESPCEISVTTETLMHENELMRTDKVIIRVIIV